LGRRGVDVDGIGVLLGTYNRYKYLVVGEELMGEGDLSMWQWSRKRMQITGSRHKIFGDDKRQDPRLQTAPPVAQPAAASCQLLPPQKTDTSPSTATS